MVADAVREPVYGQFAVVTQQGVVGRGGQGFLPVADASVLGGETLYVPTG